MTAQPSTDAQKFAFRGGRAAALWVAATGGFLLVVSAGLFIAVRWHDIPDVAKLAVVCALTGAFLVAGQSIRRTLPATGSVLYHLGAFMIPVDFAGLNLRMDLNWRQQLLAQGVLCTVAFAALARGASSVVLERAAAVAIAVAAAGVGALTQVPAPLVLAGAAVVWAIVRPRSNVSVGWAFVAGFAPVMTWALQGTLPSGLAAVGLAAARDAVPALATGVLAAGVLGIEAHRRRDHDLAFVAFGALASSALTAWVSADTTRTADVLALPAAFVMLQILSLLVRDDPFWGMPAGRIAFGAEIPAWTVAVSAVPTLLAAPFLGQGGGTDRAIAGVVALLSLGFVAAGIRQDRGALPFVASAVLAVFAVEIATASAPATAIALLAVALPCALARRAALDVVTVAGAVYAPVVAIAEPALSLGLGIAGAAVLALSAARGSQSRRAAFVVSALSALGISSIVGSGRIGAGAAGAVFVIGCWQVAMLADRADAVLGKLARFTALAVLVPAQAMTPHERLLAIAPLVAVLAADALRFRLPELGHAAAVPLQIVVFDLARAARLSDEYAGLVLCVAAVVWAGLSAVVDDVWRRPLWTATVLGTVLGLTLASGDAATFGAALIVSGGLVLGAGLLTAREELAHAGGAMITVGTWIELSRGGVHWSEAYIAPVAVHLLAAGMRLRRTRDASSWLAYAPAIAMLGGAAVAERISGGAGWHAVVAGGTGAAAVMAGGWRRLAGPLFTGTALLVVVTVYESLGVVATVPTWGWLALGGSTLLAAGVAMERSDTTPLDVGRRVVDVVATRFE
jgi:hypothetical protein